MLSYLFLLKRGQPPPTALFARRIEQRDIAAQRKAYGGNAVNAIAARSYAPTPSAGTPRNAPTRMTHV